MSDRNPDVPQSDDPDLLASAIRLLRIVGPLGRFNVLDTIVPVINMGDVVTRAIVAMQPSFRSNDLFTAGPQLAAPPNTRHADTGQLTAGTYDIQVHIAPHITDSMLWRIRHRDAVDAANVVTWYTVVTAASGPGFHQVLGYEFDEDERLIVENNSNFTAGVTSVALIFARLRT